MLKGENERSTLLFYIRDRLKEEMEKQDIKQCELAEKIEESPAWLNQQLNRNKTFKIFDLIRITDGLGITVDSILPEEKRNHRRINFEEYLKTIIKDEVEKLKE